MAKNLSLPFVAPQGALQDAPKAAGVPKGEAGAPRVYSVAELTRILTGVLDDPSLRALWIEGEVSSLKSASSGHVYFTLKDEREDAAVETVMYRSSVTPKAKKLLVDGARVRVRARPTLWPARGRLQMVADRAELSGQGAQLLALKALQDKLAEEGLFRADRKRALPRAPRIVGVVTSREGAAIHDIKEVAFRRGGARILLAASRVQGEGAGASLCTQLLLLSRVPEVDVIILGRGGGSSEDLAAFNDEALVRAVANCPVPVVSAVGHEVDTTLTDLAADVRAATPSQAAELVVPDRLAQRQALSHLATRLLHRMQASVHERRHTLALLRAKLGDPRLALIHHEQKLDDLALRATRAITRQVAGTDIALRKILARIARHDPRQVLGRSREALRGLRERLFGRQARTLDEARGALSRTSARLDALSPLKVLGRGYALARTADGLLLRSAQDTKPGARLELTLHEGSLEATVVQTRPAEAKRS